MKSLATALCALLAACGPTPAESSGADRATELPSAAEPTADPRRGTVLAQIGDLDSEARAAIGYADIGGDEREEALVYLADPTRCGSGGCALIILTPSGNGWRSVGETSVTRLPVHRLLTRKDGWNDLAVGVGGGGAPSGIALLRFDRTRYPSNPSIQPQLNRLPEGARLLIADDESAFTPAR